MDTKISKDYKRREGDKLPNFSTLGKFDTMIRLFSQSPHSEKKRKPYKIKRKGERTIITMNLSVPKRAEPKPSCLDWTSYKGFQT